MHTSLYRSFVLTGGYPIQNNNTRQHETMQAYVLYMLSIIERSPTQGGFVSACFGKIQIIIASEKNEFLFFFLFQ